MQAQLRKSTAVEIMDDAKFELHKWNSNVPELEDEHNAPSDDQSFAKQQLQVLPNQSKLLGLKWNKSTDTISVEFPERTPVTIKRGLLATLAKIYDPLGLVSPVTLQGKLIYRDVCDSKVSCDSDLPQKLQQRWNKFVNSLPKSLGTPRPVAPFQQPVQSVESHAFGDASMDGVGAVVYSVVRQESGITTSLVAAKSRLTKKSLTVPRLELVSAHMSTNLVINVKNAFVELQKPDIYAWLDSTVALHWLLGNGQYKQFVANRVGKIKRHGNGNIYKPRKTRPTSLVVTAQLSRNRGGTVQNGCQITNVGRRIQSLRNQQPLKLKRKPLKKYSLWHRQTKLMMTHSRIRRSSQTTRMRRTLRVQAWVLRFTTCRHRKGPLTSDDLRSVREWWIKREQEFPQTAL